MSKTQKRDILLYSFSGMLLISLIIYTGARNDRRRVDAVQVDISEQEGIFFTDQLEIKDLLKGNDHVIGLKLEDLDAKTLEKRVETNPFVREAQVYTDLQGQLQVQVKQAKPIARLFIDGSNDRYIDTEGRVLPVNAKHTARVPLLETEFNFLWEENLHESTYGEQVHKLLLMIDADHFWKAQIAHVYLKKDGEVIMYPQVTKQLIEFGKPENMKAKFAKLMIFYKEILPKKGWNAYDKVNVKFENQIVCE